ncbi:UvrD-helicase domain-containing protein [Enterococcus faecalis]|nr:UvrD-helicase domain-containing protein [Enterococcus faecalis]EGO7877288.1 UvrD-helicase domain-containing protein [Enterococcus faecalis]EGO8014753.1 UvrD-helicase domain-containing protein [Enterococcus faecalis]EHL2449592.1 UvrD-helicase domain-containing protein [Enterococcus faecalis]EHU5024911.1 UvrD-helicase domain-containing protein [Enterococcus faecalis]EKK5302338.1 UvrD-helicase domain-containing protein [Enterococcus faecalis]
MLLKGGISMTDEKIYEQQHLTTVYHELQAAKKVYEEQLANTMKDGKYMLEEFGRDSKLNFDSYADNLETFAMLEMKNREIDQWNLKNEATAKNLDKVKRLLQVPYFGKIGVTFEDSPEEPENFYIGVNDFTSLEEETRIHDWRSPIASLFYDNVLGKTAYTAHQQTIPVQLDLKRQLIIEKDQLINYFDTTIAIQDDVLLHSLEEDASPYMKDITTTIQQEQNQIIRDETQPLLLVNGIAGSGKTSAIMQRIAYLLYQHRAEITADNILLLSPNSTFIDYISQVLPNLGERNPLNLTLLQFLRFTTKEAWPMEEETDYFERITRSEATEQEHVIRSKEFATFLLSNPEKAVVQPHFFRPLTFKKQTLFTSETIFKLYQETPADLSIRQRISATKEKLTSLWTRYLLKQAHSKKMLDQFQDLTEAEQVRYFGTVITEDNEKHLADFALKRLKKKYRSITAAIKNDAWLDQWAFFETFYSLFTEKSYQKETAVFTADEIVALILVKHAFIENLANQQMAFILVDEVQDYTEAQLLLLLTLFPKASFTLAGDENQAIFNTAIEFSEAHDLLVNETSRSVGTYQLLNSYRSSKEITRLFQTLGTQPEQLTIVPIRHDGEKPTFIPCDSASDYLKAIVTSIATFDPKESTAIITKTFAEKEQLTKELSASLSLEEHPSLQVLSIDMAKGLEFDNVILHNPNVNRYSDNKRDKKILYTAISRGMKRVVLPYTGTLSEWFTPYLAAQ